MIVTPSIAYGCIDLLGIISRSSMLNQLDAHNIPITNASARQVLETLTKLKMVGMDHKKELSMLAAGSKILKLTSVAEQVRMLMITYIDVEKPPWLQLVPKGRRFALQFAPEGVKQIFYECGLARDVSIDVVAFWDSIAQSIREEKDLNREEIGRKGEAYTIDYEADRVGKPPSWVAIDDNTLGYDVLSIVTKESTSKLRIEVKATIQPMHQANFYISPNEWEIANNSGAHKFYLWLISERDLMLAILSVDEVGAHVPILQGSGSWTKARIPYEVFSHRFFPVVFAE